MTGESGIESGSDHVSAVGEPLLDAAMAAFDLAPGSCSGNRGCEPYHRLWPWLRLFGLASSPERHAGFFASRFAAAARPDVATRVLVSGCADQAMVAHVAAALGEVQLTVVDTCPTPLELCRRFASHHGGLDLDVVAADALTLTTPGFDIVCTHSFLSQFPRNDRPALAEAWRRAVDPGGSVVTTTRLDPRPTAARFRSGAGPEFADRVRGAAAGHDTAEVRDRADDLAILAEEYVDTLQVHPIASADELNDLFTRAGFGAVSVHSRTIGGVAGRDVGPGVRQSAVYAEVVASP